MLMSHNGGVTMAQKHAHAHTQLAAVYFKLKHYSVKYSFFFLFLFFNSSACFLVEIFRTYQEDVVEISFEYTTPMHVNCYSLSVFQYVCVWIH